jgi:GGDEF domain-containing protein
MDYQDVLAQSQVQLSAVAAEAAQELLQIRHDSNRLPAEDGVLQELHQLSRSLHDAAATPSCVVSAPAVLLPAERGAASCAAQALPATPASAPPQACPAKAPATGTTLASQLENAVAACRRAHAALSLLLVDVNQGEQLTAERGTGGLSMLGRLLEALCRKLDHPGMSLLRYGTAGCAVILPGCDRRQVAQHGNMLIDSTRRLGEARTAGVQRSFSISVGASTVAMPPKNFPAQDLMASAERCLYGSRASGGSVMKSIEIY